MDGRVGGGLLIGRALRGEASDRCDDASASCCCLVSRRIWRSELFCILAETQLCQMWKSERLGWSLSFLGTSGPETRALLSLRITNFNSTDAFEVHNPGTERRPGLTCDPSYQQIAIAHRQHRLLIT